MFYFYLFVLFIIYQISFHIINIRNNLSKKKIMCYFGRPVGGGVEREGEIKRERERGRERGDDDDDDGSVVL